jgi:ATP-dependent DNA helicase RecG
VTQKLMGKAAASALARAPELEEWIDPAQKAQAGWPDWRAAVEAAHRPKDMGDLISSGPGARTAGL